jgi:hypothetical protein
MERGFYARRARPVKVLVPVAGARRRRSQGVIIR